MLRENFPRYPPSAAKMQVDDERSQAIEVAFERGVQRYFDFCSRRVPEFSRRHFQYPGAWRSNRAAFGFDLVKMPFNLLWAPCYVMLQILAHGCRLARWWQLARALQTVPAGFTTRVQMRIRDLIYWELLAQRGSTPTETLLAFTGREVEAVFLDLHGPFDRRHLRRALKPVLKDALQQYAITRTASADISNTVISSVAGAIALKKFTPGGFALGVILAASYAKYAAAGDFIFGRTLGNMYYQLFPPSPSFAVLALSTVLVMCGLAVVAAFSGLLTDPLQHLLGIHQYRLRKLIRHLRTDFKRREDTSFRPKDPYLARVLELFDTLKTHFM